MRRRAPMIHEFQPGTRLAFDEHIGDKMIGMYARAGCIIVHVAPQGSDDEQWVSDAVALGADVIISNDLDVGNILDRENLPVMWKEP